MRDLTRQLLSDADRAAITAAVEAAEKHTTGEIVPMVVSSSYHYPMADVIGGATLALPSAMQADVIDYEELRSGDLEADPTLADYVLRSEQEQPWALQGHAVLELILPPAADSRPEERRP